MATKVVRAGVKPPNAGMGRPKGVPNKTTALLKDAILKAAQAAGGGGANGMASYLEGQAKLNPGPFMALLGKVLPMQIAGDKDNPVGIVFKTVYEQHND